MGSHIIGFFEVGEFFIFTVSKRNRMFVPQTKSKVFFVQSKKLGQFIKVQSDEIGIKKITSFPKGD